MTIRAFNTRFRFGCGDHFPLTSPVTATRRLIMQKARRHRRKTAPTACRRTGSGTFSLPYYGFFSPFPHGTGSLSVSGEYLALAGGPAGFTQGSTCPALLGIPIGFFRLRVPDCHRLWSDFPDSSAHLTSCHHLVPQPPRGRNLAGLGSAPFARRYWGHHVLFSSPPGTKMFQFPGFASPKKGCWSAVISSRSEWPAGTASRAPRSGNISQAKTPCTIQ